MVVADDQYVQASCLICLMGPCPCICDSVHSFPSQSHNFASEVYKLVLKHQHRNK